MSQSKTVNVATEAIGKSISVRDSLGDSVKDKPEASVEVPITRETKSISQAEIAQEKMVSAKDGTVTTTHHKELSGNNGASTKYQDDDLSHMKFDQQAALSLEEAQPRPVSTNGNLSQPTDAKRDRDLS